MSERDRALADAVRSACLAAAVEAYEDAGLQGLCAEGRWECAVQAIRRLELAEVLDGWPPRGDAPAGGTQDGRSRHAV